MAEHTAPPLLPHISCSCLSSRQMHKPNTPPTFHAKRLQIEFEPRTAASATTKAAESYNHNNKNNNRNIRLISYPPAELCWNPWRVAGAGRRGREDVEGGAQVEASPKKSPFISLGAGVFGKVSTDPQAARPRRGSGVTCVGSYKLRYVYAMWLSAQNARLWIKVSIYVQAAHAHTDTKE